MTDIQGFLQMESSDDEGEILAPRFVDNYHFVNENEEPTCFSLLPFQWEEGQRMEACKKQIFLHGVGDDGLQKIYRQVTAWKLNLEGLQAEICVLTKDKKWIMLLNPRKSFLDTIRKMMITTQCIHYLKRNHDSTEKSLWDHVRKVFSHFEEKASPDDILGNAPFIRKMIERDDTLAKSKLLVKLSTETSKKANASSEGLMIKKTPDFINDDDENNLDDGAGDSGEESDQDCFDSVCSICDNGGELLCCEGKCLRSFHAYKEADNESNCKTLGYTRAEVKAIQNFKCLNCRYEKHQCFSCGKLGSSNLSSLEVFQCANATCGHFFHPKCVAKLVHDKNETEATELEKSITVGQKFVCPFHKCLVCKLKEDKLVEDLQFAMCRRCPTSYHRKCLPRTIAFEDSEDGDIIQRAWDDLIPNRILIYCTKHAIDEELGTPKRNHITFPEGLSKKKDTLLAPNKQKALVKRKGDHLDYGRPSITAAKKKPMLEESGFKIRKDETTLPQDKRNNKVSSMDGVKLPVREKLKSMVKENREKLLSTRNHSSLPTGTIVTKMSPTSEANKNIVSPSIVDSEVQKRVLALVRKSELPLLTLEKFINRRSVPTTHSYSSRHVDKSITLGKVEGAMEAVQTALQNVDEDNDGSIENAKDVCEPEILYQIMKWRNKLSVYLAPFLHGMLYTSFGRHFTKVDILKEIVDKFHCYVQSGDTIVDFCCGANDFSVLMKEKLEATGKKCHYKNYDVIPPKNDFMFTKKDWMKVRSSELCSGSQLIMGLNPPFGVKASLANKFIDKALEHRPKLLILIVPKETQRLDEKKRKYDLIWEDDKKLSGKAFYLPGIIDAKDKQLDDWNLQTPPLYLWSRSDWTSKHMDIAKANGHISIISDNPSSSHLEDGAEIPDNHLELEIPDNNLEPKIPNRAINGTKETDNVSISRKLDRQSTVGEDVTKRPYNLDYRFRGSDKRKIPNNKNTVLDKGKIPIVNDSKGKPKPKLKKSDNDDDVRKSSQGYEVPPLPPVSNLCDGESSDMCISSPLEETYREDNVQHPSPISGYGIRRSSNDQRHPRHFQGRYIDDGRNSDRFYDLADNNPFLIPGHNENYGLTRYRSSDPSIVGSTSTMARYAPRLDELNRSLPTAEINGINRGLPTSIADINRGLPSMAEVDYRLPSNRGLPSMHEIDYRLPSYHGLPSMAEIDYRLPPNHGLPSIPEINLGLPSTAIGGSSTMERYSARLDEMNRLPPIGSLQMDRYGSRLNNPNLLRPEIDPNPLFSGGSTIADLPMAEFASVPHMFPNHGSGWLDD